MLIMLVLLLLLESVQFCPGEDEFCAQFTLLGRERSLFSVGHTIMQIGYVHLPVFYGFYKRFNSDFGD